MTNSNSGDSDTAFWRDRAKNFRSLMHRETRTNPVVLFVAMTIFIFIPLLPASVLVISTNLSFEVVPEAKRGVSDEKLEQILDLAATRFLDTSNRSNATSLQTSLSALVELEKRVRASQLKEPIQKHATYRAQVILLSGLTVFWLTLFVVALAQSRLVLRLWEPQFERTDQSEVERSHKSSIRRILTSTVQFFVAIVLAVVFAHLALVLILNASAADAFKVSPVTTSGLSILALIALVTVAMIFGGLRLGENERPLSGWIATILRNAPGILIGLTAFFSWHLAGEFIPELKFAGAVAGKYSAVVAEGSDTLLVLKLSITALTAVITISVFGAWTLARNYPGAMKVDDRHQSILGGESIENAWIGMLEEHKKAPFAGAPLPIKLLSAKDCISLIRLITTVLAVLFVITIIVASLGLDLLELQTGFSGELLTAVQNSNDAWLTLIGAIFTVQLALIYLWPVVHLSPFAEAEADGDKPTPNKGQEEQAEATIDGTTFVLTVKPAAKVGAKDASAVDPSEEQLAQYLGANKTKFSAVIRGSQYGANFHELFTQGRITLIIKILTILSPSLISTILQTIK